jgi:hypothetical protein
MNEFIRNSSKECLADFISNGNLSFKTDLCHPVGYIYDTPHRNLCSQLVGNTLSNNFQSQNGELGCCGIGTTGNFFKRFYCTNFIKELKNTYLVTLHMSSLS